MREKRAAGTAVVVLLMLLPWLAAPGPKPQPPANSPKPPGPLPVQQVYLNDFEKEIGEAWSLKDGGKPPLSHTPNINRGFLGELGNDCATLWLQNLPAHKCVRVTFELFIIRSWDGEQVSEPGKPNVICGPDVWQLQVKGGPFLISSSFSNVNQQPPYTYMQSFPEWHGDGTNSPLSGASQKDSLGFLHQYNAQGPIVSDAVYSLTAIFPHADAALALEFKSSGLELRKLESWGIDNVKVEVLTEPLTLEQKDFDAAWRKLDDTDAADACKAFWTLAWAAPQTLERLAKIEEDRSTTKVQALVAKLDDDRYDARVAAASQLRQMGPSIVPALRKSLAQATSPEVRSRLQGLLEKLGSAPPPPDPRRQMRLVHLKEILGVDKTPPFSPTTTRAALTPE